MFKLDELVFIKKDEVIINKDKVPTITNNLNKLSLPKHPEPEIVREYDGLVGIIDVLIFITTSAPIIFGK